ncbi:MAG: DUF3299 domain-containing protein [Rhodothermales bacterium]
MESFKKIIRHLILAALLTWISTTQVWAQQELSWNTLEDFDYVEKEDGFWGIEFGEAVRKLAGTSIKIYGFMMPLENSMKQSHFILSMMPLDGCQFCAPGTQAQFIEVKVSEGEGIEYTLEPIDISGTFELLPDAPIGVYFLVKDAELVD